MPYPQNYDPESNEYYEPHDENHTMTEALIQGLILASSFAMIGVGAWFEAGAMAAGTVTRSTSVIVNGNRYWLTLQEAQQVEAALMECEAAGAAGVTLPRLPGEVSALIMKSALEGVKDGVGLMGTVAEAVLGVNLLTDYNTTSPPNRWYFGNLGQFMGNYLGSNHGGAFSEPPGFPGFPGSGGPWGGGNPHGCAWVCYTIDDYRYCSWQCN